MPHLLDPLSPAAERTVAPSTDSTMDTRGTPTPRFPLGLVILAVSPLAAADVARAAVIASLAAGNRTIVTFPAGADACVRHTLGALADRVGGRALSLATSAALATDPDVDLGHIYSIGASRRQRSELLHDFTTDFPVDEWNERVGAAQYMVRALAHTGCGSLD